MNTRRFLASVGIAVGLATSATLLPATTAPAEAAPNYWGAIAYDYSGRTAYAVNYGSRAAAVNRAKRLCGSRCGYASFYRSCGAAAYKFTYSRTRIGTAYGYPTRAAAQNAAKRKAGAGSRIRVWACTAGR